ncbi:hypothetical protein ZIOFF_075130 [Zingiber officinale]|uniref:Uncharacterized protein n=1 Tax=Zingiber officinale TaxID=94328 RepID=A0A8J5C4U3_ZINOF|nr:hypothetical protein ZIOFF_075130 [Zingiber officinale]
MASNRAAVGESGSEKNGKALVRSEGRCNGHKALGRPSSPAGRGRTTPPHALSLSSRPHQLILIRRAEISTDIDPPPLSIAEANLSGAEETYEAHLALRRARARFSYLLPCPHASSSIGHPGFDSLGGALMLSVPHATLKLGGSRVAGDRGLEAHGGDNDMRIHGDHYVPSSLRGLMARYRNPTKKDDRKSSTEREPNDRYSQGTTDDSNGRPEEGKE